MRDLLMEKLPSDVDFATTATPQQMQSMFEAEHIRMFNTRGEKLGTVTCRINDKVSLLSKIFQIFQNFSYHLNETLQKE